MTAATVDPTGAAVDTDAASVPPLPRQPSDPVDPVATADDTATVDTDGDPVFELTADARASLREAARVRWRGWLAPLDKRAGDLRVGVPMPPGGTLKHRDFPLPLFWQKETSHGGQIVNGAVEIGTVTYADIRPNPDRDHQPWLWGTGFIDLNDPDGVRYARRLEDGMSRWISVKLDFDPEFEPPKELLEQKDSEGNARYPSPTDHPEWWRLMNVTAESQPAFDNAVIELADDLDGLLDGEDELDLPDTDDQDRDGDDRDGDDTDNDRPHPDRVGDCDDEDDLCPSTLRPLLSADAAEVTAMSTTSTASTSAAPVAADSRPPQGHVTPASGGSGAAGPAGGIAGDHGSGDVMVAVVTGDTSLPIAARDTKWNGDEAATRLIEWAGGRFKLDPQAMAKVFLYRESEGSPKFVGSWKFPIADVIGGRVQIVPAAVFAAAAVLRGARGGTKIPSGDQQAIRGKLNTLYRRMREQFKDDKIRSPFEAAIHDASAAAAMRTGDKGPRTQPPWRRGPGRRSRGRRNPNLTASAGSWAAQVAAAVPEEPPAEWFTDPGLAKPSKVRVTDEGRVFGHVAAWNSTHAAFPGVHPPRNRDKSYAKFHRHPVRVAGGGVVKTGPLATGGHTSTEVALPIEAVQAHYDDPRYVVADVVCGEDEHGIWVSGALRPGVSPFQIMLLDRYSISGDWRYGELLAACSVSVPGFHLDADTEVASLTAAACDAGVVDLPVVAEAAPALIADAGGVPAVLIAAGVVVDDDAAEEDAFAEAIDGLGNWLSEELAALRQEFGMATAPRTEQVIAQLRDLVSGELTALRAEFGLTPADGGAQGAGAGDTTTTTGEGDGTAATTTGGDKDTGTDTAAHKPADGETADAAGGDAPGTSAPAAPAQGDDTVAEFKTWLAGEFAALRSEHAAATPAPAPAPAATAAGTAGPGAPTGDILAERSALVAFVHGDSERSALAALVHGGVS